MMLVLKGLYAIVDAECISTDKLVDRVMEVLSAGVKILQYRDKINNQDTRHTIARKLKALTIKHQAILIINDDASLAKTVDADGVHLGNNDSSISAAKNLLGPNKIIGASCYNRFENAPLAVAAGASYIAFGSFFNSTTKPSAPRACIELITRAKKELNIPVCAIGGITKDNVMPLLNAGVDMIAVISAIFSTPNPKHSVDEYLTLLQKFDLTA